MNQNENVRYILNPLAVTESLWAPEPYQIIFGVKNKSYLNSLWLGLGWNFLTIPEFVYRGVIIPAIKLPLPVSLFLSYMTLKMILIVAKEGITGRCMAVDVTAEQRFFSEILDHEQGKQALDQGCDLVLLDLMLFEAQKRGMLPDGYVIPGHPQEQA